MIKNQSKSQTKSQTNIKIKSKSKIKSKLENFDVSVPWGEAISQQIGSSEEELKTNLPNDPNLQSVVTSTCSMVRNLAVKELLSKNSKAGLSLKDICQGTGQIMFEGEMVKTGACHHKKVNHNDPEQAINIGDGSNNIGTTCLNKEGDIQLKKHNFVPSGYTHKTEESRLFEYNTTGEHNTTGLGAKDQIPLPAPAFIQTSTKLKNRSKMDSKMKMSYKVKQDKIIPDQYNPNLSGKGFTFNSSPVKSQEAKVNTSLQHNSAYKSKLDQENGNEEEEKADESKAILGDISSSEEIFKSDPNRQVVKMEVPEWICATICAGIDIDGLNDGSTVEDPDEITTPHPDDISNRTNPLFSTEEGHHLQTSRKGSDNTIVSSEMDIGPNSSHVFTNVVGAYECGGATPDWNVCLDKGAEISHWISERILNLSSFCQYESGNCTHLEPVEK